MSALVLLIPVALLMGLIGLVAFMWALGNGQFDDPDGAAARILDDDEPVVAKSAEKARKKHSAKKA